MKFLHGFQCLWCLACLHGAQAGASSTSESGHPITKVIKMLEGLKAKAIVEGKKEAASYEKFTYWCATSTKTLKDSIADEKETINELEDLISGKTEEKQSLEKAISSLEEEIAKMQASAKKAKEVRDKGASLYKKELKAAEGTIKAVGAALSGMSSAEKSTETSMMLVRSNLRKVLSFLSLDSSVSEEQLGALQEFASEPRPKHLSERDASAHVKKYDFKSGDVIGLLKSLKSRFEDDKLALTKAETNAASAYDLAKKAGDDALAAAQKSKENKVKTLAKVNDKLATSEKELKNEKDDFKTDSKSLADTEEDCATKKTQWDERSTTREQEIEAMGTAMKILAKATGVRTKAPDNPILPASPAKFLQLRMESESSPKLAAVSILRDAARKTHSRALERFAVEIKAHLSDPFKQVNGMIEKMIFRLMDEQRQEDEHKLWCDQELQKTNTMMDDKSDKINELKVAITAEKSSVAKLIEEIKSADDMISSLVSFKREATEIREAGKKENTLAVKDAETSQKALANAISVLTAFYKESGEMKKEPWEFFQEPVKLPKNPATWDSPYTGVADPKSQPGGIISVLETIMSDFSRMEAETKAQEVSDQKEYEQAMSDNEVEMARRQKETEMKSNERKRRADKMGLLESQKKDTSTELEKTNQYLKDLEPACGSGDSSYDDRKAARTTEIGALQKAQDILQDAFEKKGDSFLQKRAPSFLQVRNQDDDDDGDDDAPISATSAAEDEASGEADARAAEAEAIKAVGGEEDEEQRAEREEKEQEEVESMEADSQYNFDGNPVE